MNDLFGRLARRALGAPDGLTPRLPGFYGPVTASPEIALDHHAHATPARPRDDVRTSARDADGTADVRVPFRADTRTQHERDPVPARPGDAGQRSLDARAAAMPDAGEASARSDAGRPHAAASIVARASPPLVPQPPRTARISQALIDAAARREAPEAGRVHVSIGRVEVRATLTKEPAAKPRNAAPGGAALGDYLRRRAGGAA